MTALALSAQARPAALVWLVAVVGVSAALALGPQESASRLLVLLVAAPLAEEAIFRAGLQEFLIRARLNAAMSIGTTAVVFAVAHAVLRQDPLAISLLVPAVLLGLLYQQTRSVLACAALHAAMNACWLTFAAIR